MTKSRSVSVPNFLRNNMHIDGIIRNTCPRRVAAAAAAVLSLQLLSLAVVLGVVSSPKLAWYGMPAMRDRYFE